MNSRTKSENRKYHLIHEPDYRRVGKQFLPEDKMLLARQGTRGVEVITSTEMVEGDVVTGLRKTCKVVPGLDLTFDSRFWKEDGFRQQIREDHYKIGVLNDEVRREVVEIIGNIGGLVGNNLKAAIKIKALKGQELDIIDFHNVSFDFSFLNMHFEHSGEKVDDVLSVPVAFGHSRYDSLDFGTYDFEKLAGGVMAMVRRRLDEVWA
jgi:hypothetical protein